VLKPGGLGVISVETSLSVTHDGHDKTVVSGEVRASHSDLSLGLAGVRSEVRTSGRLKRFENLAVIIQPSVSRTPDPSALYPSSKLLGYFHSSALRTDKPTFCEKPR
jgi:hypothetical protein